jgi:UDP-glucose 4-epimerase
MVLALLDAGEDVVVLDNLSTGFRRAVPANAEFVAGDAGDRDLLLRLFLTHRIDAVIHFAGSIVVPESVVDPLRYYGNNTCVSRTLMAASVEAKIPHFIFSSTAAVYGMPEKNPVAEDAGLHPISPYGTSKLMTELMLRDTASAHGLRYVALRYFNVAGADPQGRSGQSTARATHLVKVACETALGERPCLEVFGTDYPTQDGTCIRDYIHVSDLARAHLDALRYLRGGGHEPGPQLRLRRRLLGARGDRLGQAGVAAGLSCRDGTAPGRRPGGARGAVRPHRRGVWLEA